MTPAIPSTIDPLLDAAIARDTSRGRRIAAFTWLVAILHGVLGFGAVQAAALFADVDGNLASTPAVAALAERFGPLRVLLVITITVGAILVQRWLRGAVATAETLAGQGAIEGGPVAARGGLGAEPARGRRPLTRLGILLRPAGVPPDRATWADIRVGSGRRRARLTGLVLLLAAIVGAIAIVGLAAADDAGAARRALWIAGLDAGLWVVGTLLLGAIAADVAWRIAVAGRAAGHFAPLADAPTRTIVRLAPAILIFGGLLPIAATAAAPHAVLCPAATLRCAEVVVPVDHAGPAVQPVLTIVYGVHEATGPAPGTLVVAVGGPGGSGLGSADRMIEAFDPRLVAAYDIVFWDQRGVGRSDGHDCPIAGGIYSTIEPTATSARAFVDACLKEADTGSVGLGRYATRQAAEDVESIRQRLGVDRFVLYGESYGTELAQVYAAAHPDRLTALILDGSVDLTLTANQFWAAAARSFDATLNAAFTDCGRDSLCNDDVADPAGTYDRLIARLLREPETVSYRDLLGQLGDHRLDGPSLESAVGSLLYEPRGRALILRAIAASNAGDDVPIARLADLFGPGISGAVSAFAYHAILCADYRVSPTADTADFTAVVHEGESSGALATRTREVYFAQLPCLYWPDQPMSAARPAGLTDQPEPIFVLGATLDPITPIEQGRSIAGRARDAYLIESTGGPHVTFGRGKSCVDGPILDYLLEGRLPPKRTTECADEVASPYIPLTALDASDYTDALDAMSSVADEILADPLYALWGGGGDMRIGCRYGGWVDIHATDRHDEFAFEGCELARGMALDGSGGYDRDAGTVSLDLTFPEGSLSYSEDDGRAVTGAFRGQRVDQSE